MPEDKKPAEQTTQTKSNDSNDTLMGVLAYLGILCLIPLFAAKDSEFAQYHAKQGLTLFVFEIGLWVIDWILIFVFWPATILMPIVSIAFLVLSIIGIVNVINGKKVPLPIIGGIHIMK